VYNAMPVRFRNYYHPTLIALRRTDKRVKRSSNRPLTEAGIWRGGFHAVGGRAGDVVAYAVSLAASRFTSIKRTVDTVDGVLTFALAIPRIQAFNATTSSSASLNMVGSSFPRFSALRRIPAQAFALKKYFSGTFACKICDKVDSFAALGHSPVLSVIEPPCDAPSITDHTAGVLPLSFRRLRY
jgi:hypothetical protein